MRVGLIALVLAYVLSQFYRAFLAVLSPALAADLGATPAVLAAASGYWFIAFAVMQIPVGEALDRVGPRRTASGLLLFAGLGAAIFATATAPGAIKVAMVLIGIGCAPVLMASYFIFARLFSPAVFGSLAGIVIGIGSLGNIAASLPLSAAVDLIGWRGTMWGLAAITIVTALAIFLLVSDPEKTTSGPKGSLLDLLKMPALWPILLMMAACYAPSGGLRGLWAGPYMADVFAADAAQIGRVTLIMGLAMVAGNFAYGPLERIIGSRKLLILGGNTLQAACLLALWAWPAADGWLPTLLFAGVGAFGASFPMVMAHGRAFLPAHLTGRGVTLINLFGIGAAGIMQFVSGRYFASLPETPVEARYSSLFLLYALLVIAGLVVYMWSKDRND